MTRDPETRVFRGTGKSVGFIFTPIDAPHPTPGSITPLCTIIRAENRCRHSEMRFSTPFQQNKEMVPTKGHNRVRLGRVLDTSTHFRLPPSHNGSIRPIFAWWYAQDEVGNGTTT